MPVRRSEATWNGTLKEGKGTMRLASGLYEGPYTYLSRFEEGAGTNPEELVAAAHAGCFSMFLSALLDEKGYRAERIHTTAVAHLGAGPAIRRIDLDTEAVVPGIADAEFQELAAQAKANCPISKALAAVPEITMKARLLG
jgi:lipoyl-dependent peroxiredoxin